MLQNARVLAVDQSADTSSDKAVVAKAVTLEVSTAQAQRVWLASSVGNLSLLLGTGGVKYNPFGNLLISASVLFPLTKAGLRSRVTTVIGVDYAF